MAQLVQVQQHTPSSWREIAITRSQVVSDVWEVFMAYASRLAEPILFLTLIGNIVQILPHVIVPISLSNLILSVQVIVLDCAGVGLMSLAANVHEQGHTQAATIARVMSVTLIAVMLFTVLVVSAGVLWPSLKPTTDVADKALILARVALVVAYGHVMRMLRRAQAQSQHSNEQIHQQLDELRRLHSAMTRERDEGLSTIGSQKQQITDLQTTIKRLQAQPRDAQPVTSAATLGVGQKPTLERHTEKTRAIPAPVPTGDIRERIRAIHEAEPTLSSRKIAERLGGSISHTTVSNILKKLKESEA